MSVVHKIKTVVTEYWEIFVGFLVLLVGIVIGTSGNREKVLKSDVKAKEKARVESQKKTKKAMDNLKKTGKVFTGGIYGWNALKNGTLVPNWKELWNIRCIRNRRAEGASWAAIARVLNEIGIKGKRGGKWQSGGVKRIAENTFHARNMINYKGPKWFITKKKPLAFKK